MTFLEKSKAKRMFPEKKIVSNLKFKMGADLYCVGIRMCSKSNADLYADSYGKSYL
jgi:hypothetical protein